jgi:hypothetical protein
MKLEAQPFVHVVRLICVLSSKWLHVHVRGVQARHLLRGRLHVFLRGGRDPRHQDTARKFQVLQCTLLNNKQLSRTLVTLDNRDHQYYVFAYSNPTYVSISGLWPLISFCLDSVW